MNTPDSSERKYVVRKHGMFVASVRAITPSAAVERYLDSLRALGYRPNPDDYKAEVGK